MPKKIIDHVIEEEEEDYAMLGDTNEPDDELPLEIPVLRRQKAKPYREIVKTKTIGTRMEVFSGVALKTKGGLFKEDLMCQGNRLVSKKASSAAKKLNNLKKQQ